VLKLKTDGAIFQLSTNNLSIHPPKILKLNPSSAGSNVTMSLVDWRVIVPPYCGVPRLFHQLPAAAVVEVVVFTDTEVVVVIVEVVVVLIWVVVEPVCEVIVEVDVELQDASTIAVIVNRLTANQMNLFFIFLSFLIFSMHIFVSNDCGNS
jgi:hypothetical protein